MSSIYRAKESTKNGDFMFDPYCDPESPITVKLENVKDAAEMIRGKVVRTPCTVSMRLIVLLSLKHMGYSLYYE